MSGKQQKIIGNSASLRTALARARKVARTDLSVLVTGESGTGKELFARLIHDESPRAKKTFVAINCAAIPAELLEAELFGYEKGAFSGAMAKKNGLFMEANGGTLFLDEIGDMPLLLQAKILRVLQEGEVRPVGARAVQKVDVRIVAATHRDLAKMAADGKFREDLIYRLRRYTLNLPPLRDRGRDIITLGKTFLKTSSVGGDKNLGRDGQALLMGHAWPGNIRELQNTILATAVDAPKIIGARHLRPHLMGKMKIPSQFNIPLADRLLTAIDSGGPMTLAKLHADLQVPKTTLHRHLTKMVGNGTVRRTSNGATVWFTSSDEESAKFSVQPLDRQTQAIRIAEKSGRITRQKLAEAAGVSIRTAGRDLANLVKKGILEPDGLGGRFSGFTINNRLIVIDDIQ